MPARIEWITDDARFASLEPAWRSLTAGDESPFVTHTWFTCWWDAFGGSARLSVCTVWDGDELVAALPLSSSHRRLASLANDHTPEFRPLARDAESMRLLLDAVLASSFGEIHIRAIPASHPCVTLLRELSRGRRIHREEPTHISPVIDTSGELSSYEQRRVPGLKRTRRRRRRLEREREVRFVVEGTPESPLGDQLESRLQRGLEVEASGWKRRNGTAILSSPDTTRFYTSTARAYDARGELRLVWLEVDGRPAAFTLCIEHERRLYALKTGFDESFSTYAPGLVLSMYLAEHCFERKLESLELLGDAARWKELLATDSRRHVRSWSYRPRPVPLARYGFRRFGIPAIHAVEQWLEQRRADRDAPPPTAPESPTTA